VLFDNTLCVPLSTEYDEIISSVSDTIEAIVFGTGASNPAACPYAGSRNRSVREVQVSMLHVEEEDMKTRVVKSGGGDSRSPPPDAIVVRGRSDRKITAPETRRWSAAPPEQTD